MAALMGGQASSCVGPARGRRDAQRPQGGNCTAVEGVPVTQRREHPYSAPASSTGINGATQGVLYRNPDRRPAAAFFW